MKVVLNNPVTGSSILITKWGNLKLTRTCQELFSERNNYHPVFRLLGWSLIWRKKGGERG